MIDSMFLVIVGVALGSAALIIATIENWDRLSPVFARWEWLIVGLATPAMAWTAVDCFTRGAVVTGLIFGVNAITFMWQAISAFRRRHGAASVSGNS